jgi:hypothetical protein
MQNRAAFFAVMAGVSIVMTGLWSTRGSSQTPEVDRHGWAGAELLSKTDVRKTVPVFSLDDPDCVVRDNHGANVRLWKSLRELHQGNDPEFPPQAIGDCTAQGAAYAVCVLQAVQIVERCEIADWKRAHVPYIYGAARKLVGNGQLRGQDGGLGVWAAEAVRRHGVLPEGPKTPKYSATIARQWGNSGPPKWAIELGERNLVKTIARVESADAVREAICNGYPVTVASNWGTQRYRQVDGRIVAAGDAEWSHQMCLDGYDGSGSQPWYHVRNSWGPDAHPRPIDDSPAGGFWISTRDVERMVSAGDSYAFSAFDGFPLQVLGRVCDERRKVEIAVLGSGHRGPGPVCVERAGGAGDRAAGSDRPRTGRSGIPGDRRRARHDGAGSLDGGSTRLGTVSSCDRLDNTKLPRLRSLEGRSSRGAAERGRLAA